MTKVNEFLYLMSWLEYKSVLFPVDFVRKRTSFHLHFELMPDSPQNVHVITLTIPFIFTQSANL